MIKQRGGIFGRHPTFTTVEVERDVAVHGNLTVDGTQTTLNTVNLSIDDKNITLGDVTAKTGLMATLVAGIAQVTLADTSGLVPGMSPTGTAGPGQFGVPGQDQTLTIVSIDDANHVTLSLAHAVAGAITFSVDGASDGTANGGGLTLRGSPDKTLIWDDALHGWRVNPRVMTVDGAAGRPAYSFIDSPNTGIYHEPDDPDSPDGSLSFAIDGLRRWSMDKNGLRTMSPGYDIGTGTIPIDTLYTKTVDTAYPSGGLRISGSTIAAVGTPLDPVVNVSIAPYGVGSQTVVTGNLVVTGSVTAASLNGSVGSGGGGPTDKTLVLTPAAGANDVAADGGGIILQGSTSKSILWNDAANAWVSNQRLMASDSSDQGVPAFSFAIDPDSGMFRAGADKLGFSTGGQARWYIRDTHLEPGDMTQNIGSATRPVNKIYAQQLYGESETEANVNVVLVPKGTGSTLLTGPAIVTGLLTAQAGLAVSAGATTVGALAAGATTTTSLTASGMVTANAGLAVSGGLTAGSTGVTALTATSLTVSTGATTVAALTAGTTAVGALTASGLTVTTDATSVKNLTVTGDLTVAGNTTALNVVNVTAQDKNITLGVIATPTDALADGGGITLLGGSGNKTILWSDTHDAWTFNQRILTDIAGTPAVPAIAQTGDADTGIYWPAANMLSIATQGFERWRVTNEALLPASNINYDIGSTTLAAKTVNSQTFATKPTGGTTPGANLTGATLSATSLDAGGNIDVVIVPKGTGRTLLQGASGAAVTGPLTASGPLAVTGATTTTSLTASGLVSANAGLAVSGVLTAGATAVNALTASSLAVTGGATTVAGLTAGATAVAGLTAGATTASSLAVSGATTTAALTASGLLRATAGIDVSGGATTVNALTAGATTTTSLTATGIVSTTASLAVIGTQQGLSLTASTIQATGGSSNATDADLNLNARGTGAVVVVGPMQASQLTVAGAVNAGAVNSGATTVAALTASGTVSAPTLATIPSVAGGAGVSASGATLTATGTAADVNLVLAPKGSGSTYTGKLAAGAATTVALTATGLVTAQAGLTVSAGTTAVGALTAGASTLGAVTAASVAATTLDVSGESNVANLTVGGTLTLNGTTTTINSTTLDVADKNIVLGNVSTPSDTTADGGGITLKGLTDKTLIWSQSANAWVAGQRIHAASGDAAAPGFALASDPNTGLYGASADVLGFATGGVSRWTLDENGLVPTDSTQSIGTSASRVQAINALGIVAGTAASGLDIAPGGLVSAVGTNAVIDITLAPQGATGKTILAGQGGATLVGPLTAQAGLTVTGTSTLGALSAGATTTTSLTAAGIVTANAGLTLGADTTLTAPGTSTLGQVTANEVAAQSLNVATNAAVAGNLVVSGGLTVNGTTTTVNTTNMAVLGKVINLGAIAGVTDADSDGGGIVLAGANPKYIRWNNAEDSWNINQRITGNNGTAAKPAFSFMGNTDTGIYRPASNRIGFATSGVEQWHIRAGMLHPTGTQDIGAVGSRVANVYANNLLSDTLLTAAAVTASGLLTAQAGLAVTGATTVGALSAGATTTSSLTVSGTTAVGALTAGATDLGATTASTVTASGLVTAQAGLAVTGATTVGALSAGETTATLLTSSGLVTANAGLTVTGTSTLGATTTGGLTVTGTLVGSSVNFGFVVCPSLSVTGYFSSSGQVTFAPTASTAPPTITTTSATANSVQPALRVIATTSNATPGIGIGPSVEFLAETRDSVNVTGASISAVTTAVGAGAEDFDLRFQTMRAGAAPTEKLRITAAGNIHPTTTPATTMTNGFIYLPSGTSAPTGVPTSIANFAPMFVQNSGTTSRLWVYIASIPGWRQTPLNT